MANETFSRNLIKMARREARLTQTDLARRAATSQAAISAYESGQRSPSVETLSRILAAAGFELRMRMATPDQHDLARAQAEALLPPEDVADRQTIAEALRDSKPMGDLSRFAIDDLTPEDEDVFFGILEEA